MRRALACACLALSCSGSHAGIGSPCSDTSRCEDGLICDRGTCIVPPPPIDAGPPLPFSGQLDLLFMVDNSNGTLDWQVSLTAQIEGFVRIVVTGDLDQDGVADFTPIADVDVGVVTSDMGTGGFPVPTCAQADFGDDGLMRERGNTAIAGCAATYPRFLTFHGTADPASFARDFQCVATVGTGGCGFEQQLESPLKALMPSAAQSWTAADFVPLRFFRGTPGHGDAEHAGFVRDGSVLAIVVLSDEDDCSMADPDLINVDSTRFPGELNLRCFRYGSDPRVVYPVSRYADGFLSLRRLASRLVFAPIVGIPPDLQPAAASRPDYDAILADERMQARMDSTMPNVLVPSCNVPGLEIAFPPARIVSVARELDARGAHAPVGSICQRDYALVLREIARAIGEAER